MDIVNNKGFSAIELLAIIIILTIVALISIPIVLTDDIDIINPASGYYNDICYTYTSKDGTDI